MTTPIPESALAAKPAPGPPPPPQEPHHFSSTDYPSATVRWAWTAVVAVLAAVILAFTPYTNNLDDIKVTLLHVGGGGLLVLFCWLWLRNDLVLPSRWVMLPVAGWLGSLLLTTLLHSLHLVPHANTYQWIGWLMIGQYLALFGIFLVQACTLRTYRMLELTLLFWVIVVFVECAFGLIHYSKVTRYVYDFLYFGRPSQSTLANLLNTFNTSPDMLGTVLNRQFFGDLLALWSPLCLAGAVIWPDLRRRLFCIVTLVLAMACTYLTFSKAVIPCYLAGMVLTAAGILVFTHYRRLHIPHWPYVVGGLLLVMATLGFFTFDQLSERFKGLGTSIVSRSIIWGGGMKVFEDHPILGAGPGSFRVLFPVYRDPDYHLTQISNVTLWAHNRVVDLLLEGGVVGTALYFWMLGALFWRVWGVVRRGSDERMKVIGVALICGVAAYFGTALFHPGIRWVIGATPYWGVLGLMAGFGQVEAWHQETVSTKRRYVARLVPSQRTLRTAALVAAILVWINPLPLSSSFLCSNLGYGIRYFLGAKENNEGLIYTQLERPREAVEAFSRSVQANPTFVTAYYKMAHAQNLLGDVEAAKTTYERLMEYAPHYSEVHYNMGVIRRLLGDRLENQAMQESDPAKRQALLDQVHDLLTSSREQYALAARMCNKVSIQYAYAGSLERSARITADPKERDDFLLQAAKIYDRVRDLPLTFATQEDNQREVEAQMKENAVRIAPRIYEEVGAYADAGRTYRDLFRKEPSNTRNMFKAVEMYKKAGDLKEARGIFERALARSPLNFEARNGLAALLAEDKAPDSVHQAFLHSQILNNMNKEFPNQIPQTILTENLERLARLKNDVEPAVKGPS